MTASSPIAPRRSLARLYAVQAVYRLIMDGGPVDRVLRDMLFDRLADEPGAESPGDLGDPDGNLLTTLVRGSWDRRQELEEMVAGCLPAQWPFSRLELVLRATLLVGTLELLEHTDVPGRVVIIEYVEVAHAFFSGSEPGMVNGVLDTLARTLRPGEMESDGGGR